MQNETTCGDDVRTSVLISPLTVTDLWCALAGLPAWLPVHVIDTLDANTYATMIGVETNGPDGGIALECDFRRPGEPEPEPVTPLSLRRIKTLINEYRAINVRADSYNPIGVEKLLHDIETEIAYGGDEVPF